MDMLMTLKNAGLVAVVSVITLASSLLPQVFGDGVISDPAQNIIPSSAAADALGPSTIQPSILQEAASASALRSGIKLFTYPAQLLGLSQWRLTLPIDTDHAGSPDEISQSELATFQKDPYFRLNGAKDGVIFQAHAGGATTKNSQYPRSELREMLGGTKAAWSNNSGTHTMIIRQAITNLPAVKPHVVAGQIHDGSDDVIQIRLEGKRLFVQSDGNNIGDLDTNYGLGSVFTVKITASEGRIRVAYNGEQLVDFDRPGSGFYFKAGVYVQTNPARGDSPSAYGQVVIYGLSVFHS